MSVLDVRGLKKVYPAFTLDGVSFSLEPGKITGFIGRNGAGKTTALRCLTGFVRPDAGEIAFFGLPAAGRETEIRQKIGFVSGGADFYPRKKLRTITAVTRPFYDGWDEAAYAGCLRRFSLDENKTPAQLSAGMRVKYALALALSHRAELLLLDEPTSGLDPVSRDDLLDVFLDLSAEGRTILFSTHITSDLDRCADNILYLRNGRLCADAPLRAWVDGYRAVALPDGPCGPAQEAALIGKKRSKTGFSALVPAEKAGLFPSAAPASLDDVMIHLEKEGEGC
jgi:ABC-2 type transport system ATP-binding protein